MSTITSLIIRSYMMFQRYFVLHDLFPAHCVMKTSHLKKRFHIADLLCLEFPFHSFSIKNKRKLLSITRQKYSIGGNRSAGVSKTAHFIPVIYTSGLVHCSKRRRYILLILVVILSRTYTVSKLNKQNEQTWVNFQRRLNLYNFLTASSSPTTKYTVLLKIRLCRLEALKAKY